MAAEIPLAWPEIGDSERALLEAVLASRRLSMGPKLPAFEAAMAALAGRAGGVGVNSGTMGLQLALEALGIGPGDEVVTVSYTFVGSVNAILHSGAGVRFVDVDPRTLNIDPVALEAALTPSTRAVLVVHLFGRPAPMDAVLDVARRHRLLVIEDACEAVGAHLDGRPVGSFGDAAVFAFYPNKPIATGEGGMIVADAPDLLARCRRLRNQGYDPTEDAWEATRPGYSARLSELHAALGLAQIARLQADLQRRAEVASLYRERLAQDTRVALPAEAGPGQRIAWFTFPIRLRDRADAARDQVIAGLKEAGIGCNVYFRPVHTLPYHRGRHHAAALPVTEDIGRRCLALPLFPAMREAEVDIVCRTLSDLLDQRPP